jgi:hypothetical protein
MTRKLSARTWSIRLGVVVGLSVIVFVLGVIGPLVLLRGTLRRDEYLDRFLICVAFFTWGAAYFAVKERINKLVFACLQIVVALGTEWYQTGKFAEEMTKNQSVDRWAFIIAGVLVIADGLEKIFKESEKYIPPNPTPQPNAASTSDEVREE